MMRPGPDTSAVLRREQTPGEEIANSISHGVGFLAALCLIPPLIVGATGGVIGAVAAGVFGGTLALLYFTSCLYHALAHNRAKAVMKTLDHSAIYLLIAGTYTPFTLGVLRGTGSAGGAWGWTLFAIIWSLALFGVTLEALGRATNRRLTLALYLAMGWLVLIAVKPLAVALPGWGVFWLTAGGIAYTAGVAFYTANGVRYAHFVWHLFVLAGSACHVVAVLRYAGADS